MIISPQTAANILGVSVTWVRAWCRRNTSGDVQKVGGRWLIYWTDFLGEDMLSMRSGSLVQIAPTRQAWSGTAKRRKPGPGRPKGSKNKKPYPAGVAAYRARKRRLHYMRIKGETRQPWLIYKKRNEQILQQVMGMTISQPGVCGNTNQSSPAPAAT